MGAAVLGAIPLCGACAEPSTEDLAETSAATSLENGAHLNGLHVNGLHVNGTILEGIVVQGMRLEGTVLFGTRHGVPISGISFVGAEMTASLPNNGVLVIRIDDIVPSSDPEILLYGLSYSADGQAFAPLCLDPHGAPVRAFPLSGSWDESEGTARGGAHIDDPDQITFACEGYALAKCVEMGYKPWRYVNECKGGNNCHPVALSYLHQACTRMLRADYCGDGMATTRDGTWIDVWDNFGLQSQEMPHWRFEAEWGQGGATCIRRTRFSTTLNPLDSSSLKVKKYIEEHCPARWAGPGDHTCGGGSSDFYTAHGYAVPPDARTLLMSSSSTH